MYQYEKKHIEINGNSYDFEFDIRAVVQYKEKFIVLLGIPFNRTEINNIYCLDAQANLIWQSEDLSTRYPELKNLLPYEQIGIKDDAIFTSDFYGRNYKINVDSGKIEGFNIVKQYLKRKLIIKVARIPAGTEVKYAVGTAREQLLIADPRPGGGVQYLFNQFDTDWITEIRSFSN